MRCRWEEPNSEVYLAYHDREWGRPEHDDRKLFEMLTLEGFQAGLSWLTIVKKREAFVPPLTALIPLWWPDTARRWLRC